MHSPLRANSPRLNLNQLSLDCPICSSLLLEVLVLDGCCHKFCGVCILTWFQTRLAEGTPTCPLCRSESVSRPIYSKDWSALCDKFAEGQLAELRRKGFHAKADEDEMDRETRRSEWLAIRSSLDPTPQPTRPCSPDNFHQSPAGSVLQGLAHDGGPEASYYRRDNTVSSRNSPSASQPTQDLGEGVRRQPPLLVLRYPDQDDIEGLGSLLRRHDEQVNLELARNLEQMVRLQRASDGIARLGELSSILASGNGEGGSRVNGNEFGYTSTRSRAAPPPLDRRTLDPGAGLRVGAERFRPLADRFLTVSPTTPSTQLPSSSSSSSRTHSFLPSPNSPPSPINIPVARSDAPIPTSSQHPYIGSWPHYDRLSQFPFVYRSPSTPPRTLIPPRSLPRGRSPPRRAPSPILGERRLPTPDPRPQFFPSYATTSERAPAPYPRSYTSAPILGSPRQIFHSPTAPPASRSPSPPRYSIAATSLRRSPSWETTWDSQLPSQSLRWWEY